MPLLKNRSAFENSLNRAFKKKLTQVKSGLAFDEVNIGPRQEKLSFAASFIKSRTARVLLAGAGFLADAYDLFVINLVLRLLRDEYPQYSASSSASLRALEGLVASSALLGSVFGQVIAGAMADVIGRRKIFILTALLISLGSFGSSLAVDSFNNPAGSSWLPAMTVYGQIACWRFLLGLGVGGEYPLAATVTAESSSAGTRGRLMAAVFAMQGLGSLLSVTVVLACLLLNLSSAFTWRFSLAFGAVPVLLAFPWRLRMHETETFEKVQQNRKDLASSSYGSLNTSNNNSSKNPSTDNITNSITKNSREGRDEESEFQAPKTSSLAGTVIRSSISNFSPYNSFSKLIGRNDETIPLISTENTGGGNSGSEKVTFSRWDEIRKAWIFYKWHIFGTALSWFLLDVVFYANGLFNHDVTSLILSADKQTSAFVDAKNSFLLCLIGLPGYWLSVFYIERFGRKAIQMNGFIVMAILFLICAIFRDWFVEADSPPYRKFLFLILYSLTFLFSNFGPNTTTFVIPGEIYPPEVKATCHGLSAASGKLGAATGAYLFPLILNEYAGSSFGLRLCFLICAFVAILGCVVTHFFIPSYSGRDLEDPDGYLALDHSWLRPSEENMKFVRLAQSRDTADAMIQIIDSADNYCLLDNQNQKNDYDSHF